MFEPILLLDEDQVDRFHSNIDQQMIVRSKDYYVNFFTEFGYLKFPYYLYDKFDVNNEMMAAFILRKDF